MSLSEILFPSWQIELGFCAEHAVLQSYLTTEINGVYQGEFAEFV